MKALRVQVERVVRPLRCSYQRKDRMREELLAHLTQMYEQELARSGDERAATAAALRRFGDATSLMRELQASVPVIERWAFIRVPPLVRRRKGETPLQFLLRANGWGAAAGMAGYVLVALLVVLAISQRPHRIDRPSAGQAFAVLMGFAVLQFAVIVIAALLSEATRRQLDRRATLMGPARRKAVWRIVGFTAANSVLLGAAMGVGMLLIDAFIPVPLVSSAVFRWVMLGAVMLGVPIALLQARDWRAATRRFDQWESLDLDEEPAA